MNLVFFWNFCISYPKDPKMSMNTDVCLKFVNSKFTELNMLWKISHILAFNSIITLLSLGIVGKRYRGKILIDIHIFRVFNVFLYKWTIPFRFDRISKYEVWWMMMYVPPPPLTQHASLLQNIMCIQSN